jgi:hypothetical protein
LAIEQISTTVWMLVAWFPHALGENDLIVKHYPF